MLRGSPGFTAVAILTLALGVGANAAIFSVVNAVLLRPLPYPHPEQLVALTEANPHQGNQDTGASCLDFAAWRDQNRSFSQIAGYQFHDLTLSGGGDPAVLDTVVVTALRQETLAIDKGLPVTDVALLTDSMDASVAQPRFRTLLLAVFSVLALVLAAVGIFGVVSFSALRRSQEIGIRMALGATPATVRRLVIWESTRMVFVGLIVATAVALLLTRSLAALLFAVRPTDPLTFISVALLLTFVALAAAYLPARRAMRINPMVALHCD